MTTSTIIFSATRGNKDFTEQCKEVLTRNDFNFEVLEGTYRYEDGTVENETSFKVPVCSDECFEFIHILAFGVYNQESILLLDHNDNARLKYGNGKFESLGKFSKTNSTEGHSAYSIDSDGNIFVCL